MDMVRRFIKAIPVLGPMVRRLWSNRHFPGTTTYWESRYFTGGTSGMGSYGRLAEFKASFVNDFVEANDVRSIIEFGCGDGHQISLCRYPLYIGLDVSRSALAQCCSAFSLDRTKSFYLYDSRCFADNALLFRADLSLSLDVLFHLVEDDVYAAYMTHLFRSSKRFVIIYSSDFDAPQSSHERRRCFSKWVEVNQACWKLRTKISNPYPYNQTSPHDTSLSDFYVYEKVEANEWNMCACK